jgi:RimJ/RimL family protein N-acetyltransferase
MIYSEYSRNATIRYAKGISAFAASSALRASRHESALSQVAGSTLTAHCCGARDSTHVVRWMVFRWPQVIMRCLDEQMLSGGLVGLREPRREDVETLFALDSDAEHVSLADGRPFRPRSLAARQAEYDKRQTELDPASDFFTIQRLDDAAGEAIGDVGLWRVDLHHRSAHIGISLLPSARGQGLGRDAVEVICRYGFEVRGLERLSLETLEINTAMQKTALACGFVEEGRLRRAAWYLGRRVDDVLYGLLAEEWQAQRRR